MSFLVEAVVITLSWFEEIFGLFLPKRNIINNRVLKMNRKHFFENNRFEK